MDACLNISPELARNERFIQSLRDVLPSHAQIVMTAIEPETYQAVLPLMEKYFDVGSQDLWEEEGLHDDIPHRYLIVADQKPTFEVIAPKLSSRLPEFTDQEMQYLVTQSFISSNRNNILHRYKKMAEKGPLKLEQRQEWLQEVLGWMENSYRVQRVAEWLQDVDKGLS